MPYPSAGRLGASLGLAMLLAGCGGGGGGTASTPPPPPAAANTTLTNLVASQDFHNDAVTSSATIATANNQTVTASEAPATLTVHYDVATKSYTLTGSDATSTFAPADKVTPAASGEVDYQKTSAAGREYFSLLDPASAANGGLRYVGAGYWQRNTNNASGSQLTIRFDAFTYGLDTPDAAVPRTGTASYNVNLFGFFAPLNVTPRAISGTGTISADFGSSTIAASGTAYESNLVDAYYTGTYDWRGDGRIGTGNLFSGHFAYDGGDRVSVSGGLKGRFYGPAGEEVGAVFNATDTSGTLAAGTLIGSKAGNALAAPLTVLPGGGARTYFTAQDSVLYIQSDGQAGVVGAGEFFPSANGRIDFAADGSVKLTPNPSTSDAPTPTFAAASRVAAESNAQYTIYRTTGGADSDQLTLYNPGTDNTEIALTYASFGRWDFSRQKTGRQDFGTDWFVYGVPTAAGSLARTGSAHYDAILHGSGVTFANADKYVVSGNATLDIDLSAMRYSGTLTAHATSATAAALDFGRYSFADALANTYAFSTFLMDTPGHAEGSLQARLYGPNGAEMAGTFEIQPRNGAGFATGEFAGVAIGKRQ